MEGAKIEGPITIRVPYTPNNGPMYDLLKSFSDEIDAGADTTDTVYTIWGLRLTDLVLALDYATPVDRLRDGKGRTD
jgi:hypothetical protein